MVSRNNVILAGMITVSLTVIGTILSDVFSPLSETIKDNISPAQNARVDNALIYSYETRNVSQLVEPDDPDKVPSIASTAITFNLEPNIPTHKYFHFLFWDYEFSLSNFVASLFPEQVVFQYQCSIDGQPFEDCLTPKSYGNLHTEEMHIFKVRTKGMLGNTQDVADEFRFTTVTSSRIQGFLFDNSNKPIPKTQVIVDKPSIYGNTDSAGYFSLDGIPQGMFKLYFIKTGLGTDLGSNRYYQDFIPPGLPWKNLEKIIYDDLPFEGEFEHNESGVVTQVTQNVPIPSEFNPKAENPSFNQTIQETNVSNYNITIKSNSTKKSPSEDLYQTEFWLDAPTSKDLDNIANVTYYLHPSFTPDTISSNSSEDKFKVSITNWGIFDLKAKVFFKNQTILDLALPKENWEFEK